MTNPDTDQSRIATLNACLSQAYGWAGLLREALAANDIALAGASNINEFDLEFIGFYVEHWILCLRGRHSGEAWGIRSGSSARVSIKYFRSKPDRWTPRVHAIAHFGCIELASSVRRDAARRRTSMPDRSAPWPRGRGTVYLQMPAEGRRRHGERADRAGL